LPTWLAGQSPHSSNLHESRPGATACFDVAAFIAAELQPFVHAVTRDVSHIKRPLPETKPAPLARVCCGLAYVVFDTAQTGFARICLF
jgi:hypothetical protein